MVCDTRCTVMIVRTTLIFGIEILQHHIFQPARILQIQFEAQHNVLQRIHEETAFYFLIPVCALTISIIVEEKHLAVIFEIMIGIDGSFPTVSVIIDTHQPTAQLVAGNIGISPFTCIRARCRQRMPEAFQIFLGRNLYHTVTYWTICIATKLSNHFQAHFYAERTESILVSDTQETSLAVIEHVVTIFSLPFRKIMLPAIIRSHTISQMTFQLQPASTKRKRPIFRKRQTNLRYRTGIDTQTLATTGERLVFQLHRIFLGTCSQHTIKPAGLHISLLHHYMAGIVYRYCHIYSISYSPAASRICRKRTNQTTSEIAVILL